MRDPADVLAEHLPRGRWMAERLMTTTATVTRNESVTPDPETGADVVTRDLVYQGPCKVSSAAPQPLTPEVAGGTANIDRDEIHFPVTAGPFDVGDRVEITGSTHQPHLVGRVYRVTSLHEMEWQTAQRIPVETWR